MNLLERRLQHRLQQRRQQQRWRQRQVTEQRDGVRCRIGNHDRRNVSGNDYLGLSRHPALIAATRRAVAQWGVGSTASPMVQGYHPAHQQLEQALADFTGLPRVLLFANGYLANLAIAQALMSRHDVLWHDRLNHTSLLEGARLCGGQLRRYPHRDSKQLADWLAAESRPGWIVSETVFSMEGDQAPLAALARLARQYHCGLILDDAHGFGVLPPNGLGSLHALKQAPLPQPFAYMATFGKALGGMGAFVAGNALLIDNLLQGARPYTYSTAPPPAWAMAALTALNIIRNEPQHAARLQANIQHFRQQAALHGLPLLPSDTPIQPLLLGSSARAMACADWMQQRGWQLTAMRPPTVPAGQARLRITLSALHHKALLSELADDLHRCLHHHPTPPT